MPVKNPDLLFQFIEALSDRTVTIFLVNGVKLIGVIKNYSNDGVTLTLMNGGAAQFVFFDAIATMMPGEQLTKKDLSYERKPAY